MKVREATEIEEEIKKLGYDAQVNRIANTETWIVEIFGRQI